jgi:ABC-2 type transport system ATP-binding protein
VLQQLVGHVAREDTTVFFSSHQLAEIDQIADRIGIVHRGRMMMAGVLDDLRQDFRRVQAVFEHDAPTLTSSAPGIVRLRRQGRVLSVTANGNVDAIVAEARGLGAVAVDVTAMPLKDMFLEIVAGEN